MKSWLKATSPQDVAAFYGPKYRKDGYQAFRAGWRARQAVLEALEGTTCQIRPKQTLLDAGCGNGEFLDFIARQRGIHVVGLDVTPEATHLASALLAERGSVFDCTIEDAGARFPEHFDYITCLGAIEHTMDPAKSFKSLMKCLRPGGRLLITVPLDFDNCFSALEQESNQKTNERFAPVEEWVELFELQEAGRVSFGQEVGLVYVKD